MPKGDRLNLKADPEDGTTPISNLLLEAIARSKLPGLQIRAILYLWRKTYGWVGIDGKRLKKCEISLSEWVWALDATKPSVATALSEIEGKHIFSRTAAKPWGVYSYQLNTDIKTWDSNCLNLELLTQNIQLTKTIPPSKPADISSPLGEKVKEVFARLDKERGYRPPKRKAEAASIMRMLKVYSPDQIIETWKKLKKDKFWQDKELYMMSVESQIGAIVKNGQKQPEKKYEHMVK